MVVFRGFHWAVHSRSQKAPAIFLAVANEHRIDRALISLPFHAQSRGRITLQPHGKERSERTASRTVAANIVQAAWRPRRECLVLRRDAGQRSCSDRNGAART